MKRKSGSYFGIILCIGVSFIVGYTIPKDSPRINENQEIEAIRESGYTFTNPLLECETKTMGNNQKYIPFEKDLTHKLEDHIKKNPNITTSIYFRNLRNGPWFGINENADFSPASLMKLPLLIIYLKWSEIDHTLLERKLTVNVGNTLGQSYSPEKPILSGSTYTINELIEHLIKYSDNSASNTLVKNIPQEIANKIYADLGVPLPENIDYVLSVKEYASFFRVLYNSSYLSRENSEKALKLLSESIFNGGITGKIPKEIKVAHKFGERETLDTDNKIVNQLHDCGIVYYDKYPYLICIMTRGKMPIEVLSEEIQDLSKMVFDEISAMYK